LLFNFTIWHFKFFGLKLNEQKKLIEKGELKDAYRNLVNLLKQANSDDYTGFIDKRIVSDITDTLKSVSNKIN